MKKDRVSRFLTLSFIANVVAVTNLTSISLAVEPITAFSVINEIEIKGRAPKTGYSRAQFPHWSDPDRNGCDSRNDILKRDLKIVVFKSGTGNCKVISGQLQDPFSGKLLQFDLNLAASNIDIDHVVSLSNAWQTGAAYFDKERRQMFANDPLNLLAVDARLNRQKGDGDAATWLPPSKGFRCEYVARQVAVKYKYKLWITPPEKSAIIKILDKCKDQKILQ
jgi:hypothetical protein